MPRPKAIKGVEPSVETNVMEAAQSEPQNPSSDTPKPKKERDREPYKPFTLVADLGRSSCKSLIYVDGQELTTEKLTSCVAQLDCPPGNDFGGFTLDLEELHPSVVDEKGKPKKVKTQQHWVVGNRAQAYPGSVMMTDRADAKVEFFHILLMGVIATAPNLYELSTGKNAKRRTLTIDLATLSIAAPSELKKNLKACKALAVDGIKYTLNFTNNQRSFVEGHGAAIHGKSKFPNQKTLYVADLGAGTFQISEFSILGELPNKKSKDAYHGGGGVTSLKREVAKALANGDSSDYLTRSQISTILEESGWDGEKVVALDFTKKDVSIQITFAITQWLRESPAGFALEDLVNISRRAPVIFCGGGFAISSVNNIIKNQIVASGGNPANLCFPEDLGIIAVRGVLNFLHPKQTSNLIQLPQNHDTEQIAN